jgi:hypothetical protein
MSRIGLPNESQPSLSHGRTELISQIFNPVCNCSTFIDPNVIGNTEISVNLSIAIISISDIIAISTITATIYQ